MMIRHSQWGLVGLAVWWLSAASSASPASELEQAHPQLLPGDRVLLGTVEEIRSDQAKINVGELEPRYLPMTVRKDKGLPELKIGDLVEITVNDQNLLVSGEFLVKRPSGCERVPDTAGARHIDREQRG
jgi:hypothetical protein